MYTWSPEERTAVEEAGKDIDRLIGSLEKGIGEVDPGWAAKNPEIYRQLQSMIQGKGYSWRLGSGAQHGPEKISANREQLKIEAEKIERAVDDLKRHL